MSLNRNELDVARHQEAALDYMLAIPFADLGGGDADEDQARRGALHRLRDEVRAKVAELEKASHVHLRLHADAAYIEPFTHMLTGVFGEWGEHARMDERIRQMYPKSIVSPDSESGQFFAYAKGQDAADALARFVKTQLEKDGYLVTLVVEEQEAHLPL